MYKITSSKPKDGDYIVNYNSLRNTHWKRILLHNGHNTINDSNYAYVSSPVETDCFLGELIINNFIPINFEEEIKLFNEEKKSESR